MSATKMKHATIASATFRRMFMTTASGMTALAAMLAPMSALAQDGDISAAAMGNIYNYNSLQGREEPPGGQTGPSSGDSWESCWGADDSLFVVHDDGFGFGLHVAGVAPYIRGPVKPDYDFIVPYVNHGLCRIDGDPNLATESVRGVNLNPGLYSYTLAATYSRDVIEVDGILYAVKAYSNQRDKDFDWIHFRFFNVSLVKSTDGGRNWVNNLGQRNAPPPNNREQCMFPDPGMTWPAFIHYGKGGKAPAVDNADKYVYLLSHASFGGSAMNPDRSGAYLARIPRATIANLDKNDIQYYTGGNGMADPSWSKSIADSRPVLSVANEVCPKVVYNDAFKRYLMCDEWPSGLTLYTARRPWGPWTKLVSHWLPGTYWGSLACNKWTTADGKKMWYIASGGYKGDLYPYGLLFNPVYLSRGAVDVYEAADAKRSGALVVKTDVDGSRYVTGFAKPGDGLHFSVDKIYGKGWHIVRFEYASTKKSGDSISVYVNGRKVQRIDKLCPIEPSGMRPQEWMDHSGVYYLDNGINTFELRLDAADSADGLMVRKLYVARETTYDEGENVAPNATASASSVAPGSSASAVNDGCASGGDNQWESNRESAGCWVQLDWTNPVAVHKIVLYDRPSPKDRVTRGTLTFSDGGAPIAVGPLQNDGKAGTVITFPPRTIRWVRFTIDKSDSSTSGLAEFEVFGTLQGP